MNAMNQFGELNPIPGDIESANDVARYLGLVANSLLFGSEQGKPARYRRYPVGIGITTAEFDAYTTRLIGAFIYSSAKRDGGGSYIAIESHPLTISDPLLLVEPELASYSKYQVESGIATALALLSPDKDVRTRIVRNCIKATPYFEQGNEPRLEEELRSVCARPADNRLHSSSMDPTYDRHTMDALYLSRHNGITFQHPLLEGFAARIAGPVIAHAA